MSRNKFQIGSGLALGFHGAIFLGLPIALPSALKLKDGADLGQVANRRMVMIDQLAGIKDKLNAITRWTRRVLAGSAKKSIRRRGALGHRACRAGR